MSQHKSQRLKIYCSLILTALYSSILVNSLVDPTPVFFHYLCLGQVVLTLLFSLFVTGGNEMVTSAESLTKATEEAPSTRVRNLQIHGGL